MTARLPARQCLAPSRFASPPAIGSRGGAVVVVVGLLLGLWAQPAEAARKPKKPGWVVLVHAQGAVPSSWTGRLRQAAQKAQDRNWVDPPAVTLDEVQLVLGCPTWGVACAAQVAGMTGAQNALVIEIIAKDAGAVVTIEAVSAAGAVAGVAERVEVAAVDDDGLKIAEAWVAGAVKGARPTVLIVTADLDGTEVVVDNVPRGKTPLTLIDQVAPGEHALLLRREGRAPVSRTIVVAPGILNREHGVLSSGGPAMKSEPLVGTSPVKVLPTPSPEAPPATGQIAPMAVVGWGLTGVGAVTAVVAGAVGALWQIDVADYGNNINDDGNINLEYRRTLGGPIASSDRDEFFLATFGTNGASPNSLAAGVEAKQTSAAVLFVVTGIGALVAGTGAALALTAGSTEDADAAVVATGR